MKIAIYSRKSKFTGRGESTYNQIKLCKKYANNHFKIDDFIIYEDEGFSGVDINRPQFKLMLKDAKNKKFDILICYRLDRISRNVSDFSDIIEKLNNYNISFVSVKEQFDTSTPMGRAMMYIASVFAQLERETIAERIKDNMIQLAHSGRWLGGKTPTGFKSECIVYLNNNMKKKKMYKLSPIKKELEIVKLIYNKYLIFQSLSKLETYMLQKNIKTKEGNDYTKYTLKNILTNPVYVKNDKSVYNYFYNYKAQICNNKKNFNGQNGIMAYNKKHIKKGSCVKTKDISKWIVAIGKHKGIINGDDWIKVQYIINKNKSLAPRQGTSHVAILSGLLYCSKCGSYMKIKYGQKKKNSNDRHYYYVCNMKEKSKKTRCNIRNLKGEETDNLVINTLKKYIDSGILKHLKKVKKDIYNQKNKNKTIYINLKQNEKYINNLIKKLSENNNEIVNKYITNKIEILDKENKKLKLHLNEYNIEKKIANLKILKNSIIDFPKIIDKIPNQEKKRFISTIVKQIKWDGEKIYIDMFDI